MSRRRVFWLLSAVAVLLFGAWVGPALWWLATECRAACTPRPESVALNLPTPERSVLLLYEHAANESASLEYITDALRDEARLCAEVRDVFMALEAKGKFATARKVIVSPTDPRPRILGLTWRGPVLSCCLSTGMVFTKTEQHGWQVRTGLCRAYGEGAAQQGLAPDEAALSESPRPRR